MKKIWGILIVDLLWCNTSFAISASCKAYYNNTLVSSGTYDLSEGSKWEPEITGDYIYWTVVRMTGSEAYFLYHELDRYSGTVIVRVSHKIDFMKGFQKTRRNASIDYTMDGTCTKAKKKKF